MITIRRVSSHINSNLSNLDKGKTKITEAPKKYFPNVRRGGLDFAYRDQTDDSIAKSKQILHSRRPPIHEQDGEFFEQDDF